MYITIQAGFIVEDGTDFEHFWKRASEALGLVQHVDYFRASTPREVAIKEVKRLTSNQWCLELSINPKSIYDPDGWDRSSAFAFEDSFSKDCITREEFRKRLAQSTCDFNDEGISKFFNEQENQDGNRT